MDRSYQCKYVWDNLGYIWAPEIMLWGRFLSVEISGGLNGAGNENRQGKTLTLTNVRLRR